MHRGGLRPPADLWRWADTKVNRIMSRKSTYKKFVFIGFVELVICSLIKTGCMSTGTMDLRPAVFIFGLFVWAILSLILIPFAVISKDNNQPIIIAYVIMHVIAHFAFWTL
jgi:hypothetical protein